MSLVTACTWGNHLPRESVAAIGTTPAGVPVCQACATLTGLPVTPLDAADVDAGSHPESEPWATDPGMDEPSVGITQRAARGEYLAAEFLALGTATDARVKLTSADGATKWLSIAPATVWAIARAVLESEPVR